jgi:hydrogenase maturation factor
MLAHNENNPEIADVTDEDLQKVVLKSSYATKRFFEMPTGEHLPRKLLPRIC